MSAPSPELLAAYQAALPDDIRVEQRKMFDAPCAFVKRQMFFAMFDETLVARVGPDRVQVLAAQEGMRSFAPSPEKEWTDCVQLDLSVDPALRAELAIEALWWAAALPKKLKRPKRRSKNRGGSADPEGAGALASGRTGTGLPIG